MNKTIFLDFTDLTTGLSDRIRMLCFGAAFARVAGVINVYFDDLINDQCPYKIEEIIAIKNINLYRGWPGVGSDIITIRMTPYNSIPNVHNVLAHLPAGYNINSFAFTEKWLAEYENLFPKNSKLNYQLGLLPPKIIGIHLRAGDRLNRYPGFGLITKRQIENYMSYEIPKIINKYERDGYFFYIAAENVNLYMKAKSKFKKLNLLIENPFIEWKKGERRGTAGDALIFDIFALAHCEKISSTIGGGVPYTASLAGGKSWSDKYAFIYGSKIAVIFSYVRMFFTGHSKNIIE